MLMVNSLSGFNPSQYEEGRTNLFLQSQTFGTTWSTSNVTISSNTDTAPDGTVTADSMLETATTNVHRITQDVAVTAGQAYVFSVFAKGLTRTRLNLTLTNTGATRGMDCYADLAGVRVGLGPAIFGSGYSTAGSSLIVRAAPQGFCLCEFKFVAVDSTTRFYIGGDANAGTASGANFYAGNTANGLILWGAQLELGTTRSSYIATTTASVSRSARIRPWAAL